MPKSKNTDKRLFFVQGVFFYSYIRAPLFPYEFSGRIYSDECEPSKLHGSLSDTFGNSYLRSIRIGPNVIRFTKTYHGREDKIHFRLQKHPDILNLWVGTYDGVKTGTNKVHCLITELPMEFLSVGMK